VKIVPTIVATKPSPATTHPHERFPAGASAGAGAAALVTVLRGVPAGLRGGHGDVVALPGHGDLDRIGRHGLGRQVGILGHAVAQPGDQLDERRTDAVQHAVNGGDADRPVEPLNVLVRNSVLGVHVRHQFGGHVRAQPDHVLVGVTAIFGATGDMLPCEHVNTPDDGTEQ